MSKGKNMETYIAERLKEVLNRTEVFEQKVIADQEEFMKLQTEIAMFKKENPDGTYKDVVDKLRRMQELHYYAFLLEQNLKNELIRAEELGILADIMNFDLGLTESQQDAMKLIRSGESSIFAVNSKGEVGLLDGPARESIEAGINMQKGNPEVLSRTFLQIQVKA